MIIKIIHIHNILNIHETQPPHVLILTPSGDTHIGPTGPVQLQTLHPFSSPGWASTGRGQAFMYLPACHNPVPWARGTGFLCIETHDRNPKYKTTWYIKILLRIFFF